MFQGRVQSTSLYRMDMEGRTVERSPFMSSSGCPSEERGHFFRLHPSSGGLKLGELGEREVLFPLWDGWGERVLESFFACAHRL